MTSKTLAKWGDCLGIDAVEPVPVGCNHNGTRAVVATYELDGHGSRKGALHLVSAELAAPNSGTANECSCSQTIGTACLKPQAPAHPVPGALDVRVLQMSRDASLSCPSSASGAECQALVIAACADGAIRGFHAGPALEFIWSLHLTARRAEPCIILSIDCASTDLTPGSRNTLACATDASGALHIVEVDGVCAYTKCHVENAHSAECWTAAMYPASTAGLSLGLQEHVIFSGGDDGTLAAWDLRVKTDSDGVGSRCAELCKAVLRIRKPHAGAGVTSILVPGTGDSTVQGCRILTGGYDDTLRLWDIRCTRHCVSEIGVGGGVWRIKSNPLDQSTFLLACMYDGCKVVSRAENDSFHILTDYRDHDSIVYGSAWLQFEGLSKISRDSDCCQLCTKSGQETSACSSCQYALTGSFYDHSLHLWTY